jgi:peptidoglycan/LPS O-acetylase OafA/YrhL
VVSADGRVRLRGHLPGLDGVRGLAILMVLAIHFLGMRTPHSLGQHLVVKAAGFGMLGVDLFFVLSGFLITGLLLEAKGEPHPFRNFYSRRVLRIFPLYYGVLIVCFVLLPLVATLPPSFAAVRAHQGWLWTFTSNFFIAATSSWPSLSYLSHFWSLAIEEQYYVLWPLVVLTFRARSLERICAGVLVGALALRTTLALGGMSELSISVLTPCRMDTLCTGGLLALWARRPAGLTPLVERSGGAAVGLGATILLLSTWCAATRLGLPVLHQVRNSTYALFFGALLLLSLGPASHPVGWFFQTPVLRFFGKYSYGLYVYSGILTWVFLEKDLDGRLDVLLGNHALTMAAHAALGVALSTALAMASYQLYEKHFLTLKRYFRDPRDRPPGPFPVEGGAAPARAGLPITPGREPPR